MTPDAALPYRFLAWDSDFFGLRIASLSAEGLDAGAFDRAMAWCSLESIDCLYLLTDVADLATRRLAEDRAFRLVDVRLTFELELAKVAAPRAPKGGIQVRPARLADIPDLRAMAATSHTGTRFWSDERFERAACAELYATWIEKSVHDAASSVWVVDHEGRPTGYLTCGIRADGRGEMRLAAVTRAARGQGVGRALFERAMEWLRERGCTQVMVVTQGSGLAAQRLYQTLGFRSTAVELWHHRWFDSPGRARP